MGIKKFFSRSDFSLDLRTQMVGCFVFVPECESWTMTFEIYTYRQMLRIPWSQRVTNNEVLKCMSK